MGFKFCDLYFLENNPCSLVITCWERADLLALLYVVFPCVFVTFPYGVPGQVRYLIVWIPDCCLLLKYIKWFSDFSSYVEDYWMFEQESS